MFMPTYQQGSEKKSEMVGLKVEPDDKEQLIAVCQEEDRPLGYVARELMLRGLAAYKRDGLLKEPLTPLKASPVRKADSALGVPHKQQKQAGNNRAK